jgi:cytochrome oxidase Cu insertion factor (SCO1/SenC/PrrC family)
MKKILITLSVLLTIFNNLCQAHSATSKQSNTVTFIIELDSTIVANPTVVVYDNAFYPYGSTLAENKIFKPISSSGHIYKFIISAQDHPKYFTVTAPGKPLPMHFVKMFLLEPGDNIKMHIKRSSRLRDFDVTFSGEQSAKYTCRHKLKFVQDKQKGINILNDHKSEMSKYAYQLLRADMIFWLLNFQVESHANQVSLSVGRHDTSKIAQLRAEYVQKYSILDTTGIPNAVLFNSSEYLQYRYMDAKMRCYDVAPLYNVKVFFDEVKKIDDHALRDRMFVFYFINTWHNLRESYNDILKEAIANTSDKMCLTKLRTYLHNAKGQNAYNFALEDSRGKIVKLSDYKGKVVFIDFYFTGCTFCKIFYKDVLADVEKKYATNQNIVFITISTDRDKDEWLSTLRKGEYTSSSSINLYTNGMSGNHPLIKYYSILGYPSLMLIDPEGRIVKFSSFEMRSKRELEAAIEAVL